MSSSTEKAEIEYIKSIEVTSFERARIIGYRASQIEKGAKPMMETKSIFPLKIAEEEYRLGLIPYYITRELPSGKKFRVDFVPLSLPTP